MSGNGPKKNDVVRFRAHREYVARKDETNNALMGLLAGAQLSTHFLQLTHGSDMLLPNIFPNVDHIKRFNLTSEVAAAILSSADSHLGMMAVPYVLSLHEDYLRTCTALLEKDGLCTAREASANLVALHGTIEAATRGSFTPDFITYINTLRLMRNDIIHNGGVVRQVLVDHLATWTPALTSGWVGLAHRDPTPLQVGDQIQFGHGEMVAVLAVTKRLDRETNIMLQSALTRSTWAAMVIDEVVERNPHIVRTDRGKALRLAEGIARYDYPRLALTQSELQSELSRR